MTTIATTEKPEAHELPNGILGILLVLATELMFFGGLVSAYLVARGDAPSWPPVGQPRLPVLETAFNSLFLLASGFALHLAMGADASRFSRRLGSAVVLGGAFLALQGREWIRLIGFGLTTSSGVYGAFFYLIIGAHGLHAAAGLLAILACARSRASRPERLDAAALYWYFVVAIWPILYFLVYVA